VNGLGQVVGLVGKFEPELRWLGMQEYVLRRQWLAHRGVYRCSIGIPPWVTGSYVVGQKFTWEQLADGRLVATPVKTWQVPGTKPE
jgi:hypothetical protein